MRTGRRGRAAAAVCVLAFGLSLGTPLASCSTARDASKTRSPSPTPGPPAATAVAPVAPPGLDGTSGIPARSVCTALDRAALGRTLQATVTARPNAWNDAGVPSLDLCALVLTKPGTAARTVMIGVSALPAEPVMLERLDRTLGPQPADAPEVGTGARIGAGGVAYRAGDRVVRLSAQPELSRAEAVAIAAATAPVLADSIPPARITDAACQPSGALAEQFLGVSAQLRRDYRVRGGLTCIWGTSDRTVAIVESLASKAIADPIPEKHRVPKPALAPVGQEGYFLADTGELVFRTGRRVVRVSALANPPIAVSLERLLDIVDPIMPLFIR